MDLVPDMARAAGLSTEQAERVAGTLLSAIQMSASRELYATVEQAVPKAAELTLKSAPPLGGRTGEMRAYVTELKTTAGGARLAGQLELQGLSKTQIKSAVEALLRHLQDTLGIKTAENLLAALPGLNQLLA